MPHIRFSQDALHDLKRLYDFFAEKNPEVAHRARDTILKQLRHGLSNAPEAYRPVPDLPHHREMIIKFGVSGYVARYRYKRGEDVYVLRIKHQKEDDFS